MTRFDGALSAGTTVLLRDFGGVWTVRQDWQVIGTLSSEEPSLTQERCEMSRCWGEGKKGSAERFSGSLGGEGMHRETGSDWWKGG